MFVFQNTINNYDSTADMDDIPNPHESNSKGQFINSQLMQCLNRFFKRKSKVIY